MDVKTVNLLLSDGNLDAKGLWPHIEELDSQPVRFPFEFGLDRLPTEPGLIIVRGPRQFGKSTWLELALRESVREHGPGSAYYLNGDDIASHDELAQLLIELDAAFSRHATVRRIFIDEITAIDDWEHGIKRARDRGHLRDALIITTGSKARDLRRGAERLPGRKGKLARSDYIFLPVSYRAFHEACARRFGPTTWIAYLLSGGSPIGGNELFRFGKVAEYFIQLTRDWLFGEVISSGRSRLMLTNLLHVIFRVGGQPAGFAKLAREAGLANNTVAAGYIEQLSDLLCLLPSWPWDPSRKILQPRKSCKFQFISTAALVATSPHAIRTVDEFEALPQEIQAMFLEWLVAQEIWRRAVLHGADNPEAIGFWASREHEIDFVTPESELIEVKLGRAGPLDFTWFPKIFPKRDLMVICASPFATSQIKGVRIEEFLLSE